MALIVIAIALFLALTSLRGIASFYTDYLWFESLGQSDVFTGVLGAKVALAVIFVGVFFALLWANLFIADRIAPQFRPSGPEEEFLQRYHDVVRHRVGLVRVGVSLLFAVIAGLGASSQWNEWLLFTHRVNFGVKDQQFNRDVAFYVFQLPFLSFVVAWLFAAFVIILFVTAVAHYLNGGIRFQSQLQRVTPQVKAHLSVLLALLALLKFAGYYLQQFSLTTSTRGTVDGATYTDVHLQLPAIRLLMLISAAAFVLFIVNIWLRGWRLPVLAVGLWAFVAVVAGAIVPAFFQRFRVEPAESSREERFIDRNIEATRQAMGLGGIDVEEFGTSNGRLGTLTDNDLGANSDTINNIRLWDPGESFLRQTFGQLQETRSFYEINDVDVDRYTIDDRVTQVMLATRELDTSGVPQRSWEARHLTFTHGYGVVLSPSNVKDAGGRPDLLIRDVPLENASGVDLERPAVYFGEGQGGYVIVNTRRQEIDYPAEGDKNVFTRYRGRDGVDIGSPLRRAAFALRFGDINPLVSSNLRPNSRILLLRDVHDRVRKLAPFLAYDADPYPVIVDGGIKWVVDAYTTTDRYPYAQRADTEGLTPGSGLGRGFNYVRNSVKVVVDAYDGTATFHVVDPHDPIALAYQRAFPSLFTSERPPTELARHFRYPEDLFHVQTNMWGRYHQLDPDTFYTNNDGWAVAQDPGTRTVRVVPRTTTTTQPTAATTTPTPTKDRIKSVYVLLRLPGEERESFVLMRPFVPVGAASGRNRQQLTGFMVAKSDGAEYGRLKVFVMPGEDLPDGPVLAASTMSSDPDVSRLQTELGVPGGGTDILFGNLLLIPIEDSLLYVRPVYVQQSEENQLPLLRKVILEFEGEVSVADTLRDALTGLPQFENIPDSVLSGLAGGALPRELSTTSGAPAEPSEPTAGDETIVQLLADAQRLFDEADEALRAGNLSEYQKKINEGREKVRQASALSQEQREPAPEGEGGGGGGEESSTTTTSADTSA